MPEDNVRDTNNNNEAKDAIKDQTDSNLDISLKQHFNLSKLHLQILGKINHPFLFVNISEGDKIPIII